MNYRTRRTIRELKRELVWAVPLSVALFSFGTLLILSQM